ncbi:MAG: dienelactone hydrolase family protein [Pseudomonadota bacterium]
MCDELTEKDIEAALHHSQRDGLQEGASNSLTMDRRRFSALSAGAILSGLVAPGALAATPVTETRVNVEMPNGVSDSYFVHPAEGSHPGILMWPDIRGLRPAFEAMGKRLAAAGYSVLVVNPFYRDLPAPVVGPDAQFSDPDTRQFLRGMARKLTQEAAISDATSYISFLDAQKQVDTARGVGTAGYCMGGPLIMRTAAAVPGRVKAAASFHGGGLYTDNNDSPHLLIPKTQAQVLHAVAENDHERSPDVKDKLIAAYEAAGIPAEIEVYEGTLHGWCPPDSRVYDEPQAERAWERMLALFDRAL